jgi:DEAD/DEAH box helicase domain-containing protein
MNGEIILDIETKQSFQDVGGFNLDKLEVSVVVAYHYATESYEHYLEKDLPKLFRQMEGASRIIGFNSKGFDIPVLNNYYPGDLQQLPQLDMLEEVRASLGHRLKLDTIAAATLGTAKSAHGLLAVQWWKEGKIQEIIDYCRDDVKVTKDVYEFGLQNGYVLFDERTGERKQANINFNKSDQPQVANINLTLGF